MRSLNGKREQALKTARAFIKPADDMEQFVDSPVRTNFGNTIGESAVDETDKTPGECNRRSETIKVADILRMKREGFRFGLQRAEKM